MTIQLSRFFACQSVFALAFAVAPAALNAGAVSAQDSVCNTDSEAVFCDVISAEDLVHVPGTDWVLVSSYSTLNSPGEGLLLINSQTLERRLIDWTSSEVPGPQGCPGPLEQAELSPHGVSIASGEDGSLTAYAVNHGRRTIEMFDVETTEGVPAFAWSGCIVLPESVNPNAVVALPDGRLAVSAFLVNGDEAAGEKFFAQENTGFVALWHPEAGWSEMAGSEASGNNGVEVSSDGKYLFVAAWSGMEILRLTIDAMPYERVSIPVDFLADNLHLDSDGQILAAGQFVTIAEGFTCLGPDSPVVCPLNTKAVSIDPETLEVTELFTLDGSEEFGAGTTVLALDDEYWVGTFRGDTIARVTR